MIYAYDIEVLVEDWIVVFRNVEDTGRNHTVIHNNPYQLREFLNQDDIVICGFNNKHYDDWIIQTMRLGGDNAKVKAHNDMIIAGGNGWEFPFIQYQKKPFRSIDLRDDLPLGLSLKAIEGNLCLNIVESTIDFNIPRKLTPKELEELIEYCKTDVDNTLNLWKIRSSYIKSKRTVAKIKGMDEIEAMTLTNAKLTAKFLDAKKKNHGDEFTYVAPDTLRINKYTDVVEFFNTIDYKKKYKTNIAGVPHVYGWGGIHGAIKNYFVKYDSEWRIVTIDVGSYYPSMMLVLDYISRNIANKEFYRMVYNMRMEAKHKGDKDTADALKLILNTCYGAMKNKYNDLYDPRLANAICITGMLFLTDLIEKLENVKSFELIQSNTDGIIIRYKVEHERQIEEVVNEWERRTGMNMEYTEIKAIAQKDVNNYVMRSGATYLLKRDTETGELVKTVTDKDKGKLKSKGGYVSLYGGGDFKNNSMSVLHDALVNYFMDGVPVEDTINADNDIFHYQMIAKTGSTYDGTYHEVNGKKVPVQRVNRVYATRNPSYGTIYKRKNGKDVKAEVIDDTEDKTARNDKIASLPDHCIIDNANKLTIEDIDKQFYIDLAHKRINDYLGIKNDKPKKERGTKKMAETEVKETKTTKATKEEKKAKSSVQNIHTKLLALAKIMHQCEWEKDGKNMHQQYKYVSEAQYKKYFKNALDTIGLVWECNCVGYDFIPTISDKMHLVISRFKATITDPETLECREYEFVGSGSDNGDKALYKSYTGGLKFFLANNFLVAENNDPENDGADTAKTPTEPKNKRPASTEQREEIKKDLTDSDGQASDVQIKGIKNGLKKVRAQYMDGEEITNEELHAKCEPTVIKIIKKLKGGVTKKEAEKILLAIRELMTA